jgi:hypothetical protein
VVWTDETEVTLVLEMFISLTKVCTLEFETLLSIPKSALQIAVFEGEHGSQSLVYKLNSDLDVALIGGSQTKHIFST